MPDEAVVSLAEIIDFLKDERDLLVPLDSIIEKLEKRLEDVSGS
jgi:hypothetical protein